MTAPQQNWAPPQGAPSPQVTPLAPAEAHQRVPRRRAARRGLRAFQAVAALAGLVLFLVGIVAVFRVDFGLGFFDTSGSVASFGFSPALAVAAIVLGGAALISTVADQDRGSAAVVGLVTILVGIAALVAQGRFSDQVQVDRGSAGMFVVLGAVVFVASLVPWWTGRRTVLAEPTQVA